MLTYRSTLPNTPPSLQPSALTGLQAQSPYGQFGVNHQDVVNSLAGPASTALDMAAYKAQADYGLRQQDTQRALALAGLRQQSDAAKSQRDLGTSRLQMMTGVANNLLSGLFQ